VKAVLNSLLMLIASATDRALARHVQYLKAENEILRSKLPKVVQVTPKERNRLVRLGRRIGSAINQLISIVSPRTFLRWLNAEGRQPKKRASSRRPGRPRTPEDIRELVLRIARETGWGYSRILGELRKLGVRKICRSTVVNILKEAGLDPGPQRGEDSWDNFIKRHASTLWACDFFTKPVWTLSGWVEFYILFFINIGTRRVHVAGMTTQPDRVWVAQQARNIAMYFGGLPERPTMVIRDGDKKYGERFDAVFEAEGVEVKRVGPFAPNMNAYAERWVQSVQQECLNHFLVFGEAHLRHILAEYMAHYNEERPHQGVGNRPLKGPDPPEGPMDSGEVACEERLGGLLRHYRRAG
jgi:putative transposase